MSLETGISLAVIFAGLRGELHQRPIVASQSRLLAGIPIRLNFAGEALRDRVLPALEHLPTAENVEPELSIFVHQEPALFDAARFAPSADAAFGENDIWTEDSPELTILLQRRGRYVTVVDWTARTAWWLVPNADAITYIDRAHPLQQLLTYFLHKRGRFLVHGAAVGCEQNGVLILGHGGAGKSTTALACLEAGMRYVADDFCLVSADPEPVAHSIYSTGKMHFAEMDRFPRLTPAGDVANRPPDEKTVFFFAGLPGASLADRLALRALLLARITDTPQSRLRPAGQADAFRALVGSAALHLPATRAHALRCYNQVARSLPAFVLELGADVRSTPPLLRQWLGRFHAS